MRSKIVLRNSFSSLLLQLIMVVAGFIVPRTIIGAFGSDINGMVSSIGNMLGYINLLDAGIGGVARSALYKPLAVNDTEKISGILRSIQKYFRVIAFIFMGYLLVIATVFPLFIVDKYGFVFDFTLILIIGMGFFVSYFFGVPAQILLLADQKLYLTNLVNIAAIIANTILVVILTKLGAQIHLVRIISALVFVVKPIYFNRYVHYKYKLDVKCAPRDELLSQKWDGLSQHIAYFLRTNCDVLLLTIFTSIKEVSVYAVYSMIVNGIEKITGTFSKGVEATFGDMLVRDKHEKLQQTFSFYEFMSFSLTTVFYTSLGLLIMPFISVYTKGITDANYFRPIFAYTLVFASAIFCIRYPYMTIVTAAGHFKQTKLIAITEAAINITLSIILVNIIGITGVALATVVAVLVRTIYHAYYVSKYIIYQNLWVFIVKCLAYGMTSAGIVLLFHVLPSFYGDTYFSWTLYACVVFGVSSFIVFFVGLIFFRDDLKNVMTLLTKSIKNKKHK